MKLIKKHLIILFISFLLFLVILNIYKPIFSAKSIIFPYSISKFDIVNKYPTLWNNIKNIYCINCFITIYLAINSFQKFISIIQIKHLKKSKPEIIAKNDGLNLLLGTNDNNNIYLNEKGLFQNILVTGTIGSRKNIFCNVSFTKTITRI